MSIRCLSTWKSPSLWGLLLIQRVDFDDTGVEGFLCEVLYLLSTIFTYWLSGRARQENIWLEVRASWPRAKYFPVRPDLTQSISILSYDHFCFFLFHFLVERGCTGTIRISSKAVYIFPALSIWCVRPSDGTFFLMVFQGNCLWGRMGHENSK